MSEIYVRFKDLTGMSFGLLTVMGRAENDAAGRARWRCKCECGGEKTVAAGELKKGSTRSCGCLAREQRRAAGRSQRREFSRATHPREQKAWQNMWARCTYAAHPSYPAYGGAGVTVSPAWKSFEQFMRDMGPRPDGGTIDRIDNSRGYSKDNCRWASREDQANNRRSNVFVEINGESRTIAQWARHFGIRDSVVRTRLYRGWPAHRALTHK